uniref:G-protein coupled receptors family 1 profile domain-containing protein n=1 Tax=Rhinopithecus roxellana TaxID=61622 RepID=A0A2K6RV05_RHIRO
MDPTISALGTELTPVNRTEETLCYKQTLSLTVLTCIISLVRLTGNAVVLWLLGFRMRRNTVSTYILNLAAADFLFLSGHIICLHYVSSIITMITERCLCVLWPIWYHCRRPHTPVSGRVILEWMFCDFLFSGANSVWYVWLIFLCVVLCVSSLVLAIRILCGSRKMPLTRLYVTILLTVLVFLPCGLPFGIQWALFSRIHISANPIIYFFMGSFRQHQNWQNLKLVLQRALQDMSEVDEGGGRLPEETLELLGSRWGQ